MSMVLYSRTTRWRGPYYQFCLAKLLILFFLLLLSSFLMMFFFIHSTPTTKNKSLRKNNHTQTHTFTTLMLLFWALNVGINFRIQPKIYFEKWGSSNGKKGVLLLQVFGFTPREQCYPDRLFWRTVCYTVLWLTLWLEDVHGTTAETQLSSVYSSTLEHAGLFPAGPAGQ